MTRKGLEAEPTSKPVLLVVTDRKREETGEFKEGWHYVLQQVTNEQGIGIDSISFQKKLEPGVFDKKNYPLILVDLVTSPFLPNALHGYLRQLRQQSPESMIIATSVLMDVEYARAALKHEGAAANDFVFQSIDPHKILNMLQPLLHPSGIKK